MIAELLSRGFHRNVKVIRVQAMGLTHEQSLTQSEYNVNCLNWVVGHIVAYRSRLLVELFGRDPVMTEPQKARYQQESEPITADGPDVIRFDELLRLLQVSEESLEAALADATEEYMSEETQVPDGRTASRAAQAMFTYFHDTYHTGQTDLLRQMSGMNDKVI